MDKSVKDHGLLYKGAMVRAILRDVAPKTQTRRPVTFDNSITGPHIMRKDWGKLRWDEARLEETGPSPAGNPGPYWHVPIDDIVVRVYPRIQPGDLIWGKEKWRIGAWDEDDGTIAVDYAADDFSRKEWLKCPDVDMFQRFWEQSSIEAAKVYEPDDDGKYRWDAGQSPCKWRSSILMPRFVSRLELDVLETRSQRIQDISEKDAIKEGLAVVGVSKLAYPLYSFNPKAEAKFHYTPENVNTYDTPTMAFKALWDSINVVRGFSWAKNHPVWAYGFKKVTNG